ncbi:Pro-Pol polyprotein [Dictyocoela muelleri]|nr:Pro-Pol polyprotein [Dictyocoela muelleri]
MKNIHSLTVCDALEKIWLSRYQKPSKCLSDNGRQFKSENFANLMNKYEIKQIFTSPHNPTGNSIVERVNREISIALRFSRGQNLKNTSLNIWKRINLCNNSTLGFSPYEVFFKKAMLDCYDDKININDEEILNKMKIKQANWNKRVLKRPAIFEKCELVYRKRHDPDKIKSKIEGPFKIIDISKSGNNVFLECNGKIDKCSIKNLKSFRKGGECDRTPIATMKSGSCCKTSTN